MPSEREPKDRRSTSEPPSTIPPRRGAGGSQGIPAWERTSSAGERTTSTASGAAAAKKPGPKKPGPKKPASKGGSRRPSGGKGGAKGRRRFWNYPRRGKGPVRRWLPGWRFMLVSFLLFFLGGAGVFVFFYTTTDLPEPEEIALAEASSVHFADGSEIGAFADVDRDIIDPATLPEHVGQAVVASEDQRFYENPGIDVIGIARAFWNNLRGLPIQGGSTITQQYVERYYTGQTSGYEEKIREVMLALKIDRVQSKDEILGNYLNTIYFGRGAYGIERAAQVYFGVPAQEMTVSQAALLAGIIPSPSRWDPAIDPEQAQARWQRTLDFMVSSGFLTEQDAAAQTFPETIEPDTSDSLGGTDGYLLAEVRTELLDAGFTEGDIDGGGLEITTTIDPELQQQAVQTAESLPEDAPENLRVALVSVDPGSGAILSMYGGPDYVSEPRNRVTQDTAQGGSTFKPFTMIAALEAGYSLNQRYASYSPMDVDGYEVGNFDSINRGSIDMLAATANSVNTYYVQLNDAVGPEATIDAAERLGLPADTVGLVPVLPIVLGTASPHPLDMANAYATIAAQGVRHESFIVRSAVDSAGETVYEGQQEGTRVFEEGVMADATFAMQQVTQYGTGATASQIGRPVAGKTGSSQDYRSAWFVGFVPQMATAVAFYQPGEDGTEEVLTPFGGVSPISGGSWPTTLWTQYMTQAVADLPVLPLPEPVFGGDIQVGAPPPPPAPATQEPTTQEPATEEPTTEEPTTEEPTTEEPTTEEPTQEATTEEPTQEPTTEEPTTQEPTTEEPTTEEPTTEEPTQEATTVDPTTAAGVP